MAKDQVNIRISTATREKLDWLANRHGTQTEAIAVAIHNLYREEKVMIAQKFYGQLLARARKAYEVNGNAQTAAQSALDQAHTELSQRHFFEATDEFGGTEQIRAKLIGDLKHPWAAENIWVVSGNRSRDGEYLNVYAIPLTYLPEDATIILPGVARQPDVEVDGARRWIVIAEDGEAAHEQVKAVVLAARKLNKENHIVAGVDTITVSEAREQARGKWDGDFIEGTLPVHDEDCDLRDEAVISGGLCNCPRLTVFSSADAVMARIGK